MIAPYAFQAGAKLLSGRQPAGTVCRRYLTYGVLAKDYKLLQGCSWPHSCRLVPQMAAFKRGGRVLAPAQKTKNYLGKSVLAGGRGFEPRLAESESAVLPLNYPPMPWVAPSYGARAAYNSLT